MDGLCRIRSGKLSSFAHAGAAFLPSHTGRISLQGCICQPAHAALAGRLAAALDGKSFEALQEEILDTITNHDAGWSEEDLAALEQAEHNPPMSFISMPDVIAVQACDDLLSTLPADHRFPDMW
jgi:hypothetical protein